MPAISEEVYRPENVDKDSWLAKKMASLADAGQWKVTKFETTPPVGFYLFASWTSTDVIVGLDVPHRLCERSIRVSRELVQEPAQRQGSTAAYLW